jgi:hypothetical protein
MRATLGMIAAVIIGGSVPAADLKPSVVREIDAPEVAPPIVQRRVHRRATAYGIRTRAIGRTVGMPCILPPDIIVLRNWNGPQCRWIDNVIPGDEGIRVKRIVY